MSRVGNIIFVGDGCSTRRQEDSRQGRCKICELEAVKGAEGVVGEVEVVPRYLFEYEVDEQQEPASLLRRSTLPGSLS